MPPPNRLAPDPYNALYYSVPDPAALGPQYAPPLPLRQRVENVSAGLGRGVTRQLQDVQALLSDPRAYATNTLRGLRELVRNPALVGNVLRDTARRAASGPLGLGEVAGEMLPLGVRSRAPVRRDIDVYHGSPHEFERFDPSKIGTGEGAQAYGHGLYFAESPKVASSYRLAGSGGWPTPRVNGAPANDLLDFMPDASDFYETTGKEFGKVTGAKAKELALKWAPENVKEKYKNVPDSAFSVTRTQGAVYKVDLPDKTIDKMLDWDAPLSQQPKILQDLFADKIERIKTPSGKTIEMIRVPGKGSVTHPTGSTLLQILETEMGVQKAAEYLRSVGVPGVKYLDAGSRGATGTGRYRLKFKDGTNKVFDFLPDQKVLDQMGATAEPIGTRNFVVFPGEEQQLRILKRE